MPAMAPLDSLDEPPLSAPPLGLEVDEEAGGVEADVVVTGDGRNGSRSSSLGDRTAAMR